MKREAEVKRIQAQCEATQEQVRQLHEMISRSKIATTPVPTPIAQTAAPTAQPSPADGVADGRKVKTGVDPPPPDDDDDDDKADKDKKEKEKKEKDKKDKEKKKKEDEKKKKKSEEPPEPPDGHDSDDSEHQSATDGNYEADRNVRIMKQRMLENIKPFDAPKFPHSRS